MRSFLFVAINAMLTVLVGGWVACSRSSTETAVAQRSDSPPPPASVPTAEHPLEHSIEAVKNHMQGGIGVVLRGDNGVPVVRGLLPESPAESAGVRVNDRIIAINGEATTGLSMPQVVEKIRGYRFVPIELTLRQPGEEEAVTKTIFRGSWKKIAPPSPVPARTRTHPSRVPSSSSARPMRSVSPRPSRPSR